MTLGKLSVIISYILESNPILEFPNRRMKSRFWKKKCQRKKKKEIDNIPVLVFIISWPRKSNKELTVIQRYTTGILFHPFVL